jgi:Ala-tRNA(Pro) deacylase
MEPHDHIDTPPARVHDALLAYLRSSGVAFRDMHHAPTHTSEESARARGESTTIGGKAILMKVRERFILFVVSAARRIDSGKVKDRFQERRLRFATREELFEQTGLVPGSVPPFGRPVLPYDLYVDESVTKNDRIAFNSGVLTHSVIMQTTDYLNLARGTVFSFSSAPAESGEQP